MQHLNVQKIQYSVPFKIWFGLQQLLRKILSFFLLLEL